MTDIVRSVSRGIEKRIDADHRSAQQQVVAMLAAYEEARVMVETGAYRAGSNPTLDRAITSRAAIQSLLKQDMSVAIPFEESRAALRTVVGARA